MLDSAFHIAESIIAISRPILDAAAADMFACETLSAEDFLAVAAKLKRTSGTEDSGKVGDAASV